MTNLEKLIPYTAWGGLLLAGSIALSCSANKVAKIKERSNYFSNLPTEIVQSQGGITNTYKILTANIPDGEKIPTYEEFANRVYDPSFDMKVHPSGINEMKNIKVPNYDGQVNWELQ